MLGFIVLILMSLAILSGGLLALFAGRRWYAVWLGFATYFFITRILDLALFQTSEFVRNWGGLVIALLVVAGVLLLVTRSVTGPISTAKSTTMHAIVISIPTRENARSRRGKR